MTWDGLITFLGTQDLEKTHDFYAGLLGLVLYKDQGVCRVYELRPGAYIGFCTHHPTVPQELSPIITLLTEDVDRVYRLLLEAGAPVERPPGPNPGFRIYHFFARDPNGYKVEVQRFED